jgi:hypothetical protein
MSFSGGQLFLFLHNLVLFRVVDDEPVHPSPSQLLSVSRYLSVRIHDHNHNVSQNIAVL